MRRPTGRHRSTDTILRGLRLGAEVALIVVAVGAALLGVVMPRLAGATPYAVLTGSMAPTMPPGTLVVVRPVDPATISSGDVITFWPRQHDPEVVTHRVVGVGSDVGGRPVFRTRGDANDATDPSPVHAYQVVGERWYFVPYLGYLQQALDQRQRFIGVRLAAGGLGLYALVMFVGALLDRARRPSVRHA